MPTVPGTIASLARQYTPQAITHLAKLMRFAESEAVQLGAAVALLDRGWGKPASTFADEDGGDIRIVVRHIICGERAPNDLKLVEQGNGRELVGDAITRVLPPEGEGT